MGSDRVPSNLNFDATGSTAFASSTGATIRVANSTGSSGPGSTSFPFRARVRHEETWLAFKLMPLRNFTHELPPISTGHPA